MDAVYVLLIDDTRFGCEAAVEVYATYESARKGMVRWYGEDIARLKGKVLGCGLHEDSAYVETDEGEITYEVGKRKVIH